MTDAPFDTMKTTLQWLHHCIEVETKPEFCRQSVEVHQAALDSMVKDPQNQVHNTSGNDVAVNVRTLPKGSPFDFDSVHHLPLPKQVEQSALVLEAVYLDDEDSNKMFVRVKADLNAFDGVTALHAGLNLIEYLEGGNADSLSAYPFTTSNPPLPANQFQNFEKQLKRLADAKEKETSAAEEKKDDAPREWARTPSMHEFEDVFEERPGLRYTSVKLSYREIMQRIDQAKALWNIPLYGVTINYSPATALSLCETLEGAMNRQEKIDNIALPPAGTGPPAPMNAQHVEMLFNTIFLNGYGKHLAPRTQHAKVVGYTWDWSGFLKTFPPFFHVIQIQDSMFLSISAPEPDMKVLVESGIFDDAGTAVPFKGRPFYEETIVSSA